MQTLPFTSLGFLQNILFIQINYGNKRGLSTNIIKRLLSRLVILKMDMFHVSHATREKQIESISAELNHPGGTPIWHQSSEI